MSERKPRTVDLISRFAMPVLARSGDAVATAGAAVVIAPGLALVNLHIVDGFADFFGVPRSNGAESAMGLTLCQIVDGEPESVWQVTRLLRSRFTDLGVVAFQPASDRVRPDLLQRADLMLAVPKRGAKVAAFGLLSTKAQIVQASDGPRVTWDLDVVAAQGVVSASYETGVVGTGLDWPSFRMELVLEGRERVTGGPVFDLESGCLCGFVVAPDALKQATYALALWPAMAIDLMVERPGGPVEKQTLIDLAKEGTIAARGWERLVIEKDTQGVVRDVTFKNLDQ